MNTVQANGIELAYDSFGGETNEAILLIAGLGTQMIRWTSPFCEELAARGDRVIRFDNRDAAIWIPPRPTLLDAAIMMMLPFITGFLYLASRRLFALRRQTGA